MFKNLSEKAIADLQMEQVEKWEEEDLLDKCVTTREGQPQFVFYEGPPTANGRPGVHHFMARTLKDSVNRYKTMKGFQVRRKAGWDTHGLPVEIEVEKQLKMTGKQDIEKYGIKEFNEKCRESVFTYESLWREMSRRMGYLVDLENPYITLDNDYIETGWWVIKEFFKAGLIYEGHKILPYCPRCGTGLASHEVAQGYKEVKVLTLVAKFKKKDADNEYFLAWTTTPWTLAANVALTVNPNVDYVKVKMTSGENAGDVYYLAEELMERVLGDDSYEVLEKMKGSQMEHMEYEQLMPFVEVEGKAFYVTCGDYVTTTDGTGIVHTAPAFGEDDYNTGRKYGLPVPIPVDEDGKYTATPWEGRFVMEEGLDVEIVKYLAAEGKLFSKEKIEHKQEKLLEAHFNDAIPMSLMKREQQTLSKQLAAIEHEISVRSTTFDDILKNLSLAFDLLEDCGRTYRKANDNIKKLMCQAIFNRIWIHEDGTVTTEFTDIYKNIVGPIERDLINQNIKSASAETDADFIDKLLKSYSNFFGQGLNNELLVDPKGFEPSTSRMRKGI